MKTLLLQFALNAAGNWKTTSTGLTLLIGLTVHLVFAIRNGTATEALWTATLGGMVSAVGFMLSGDGSRSASRDALNTLAAQVQQHEKAIQAGTPLAAARPDVSPLIPSKQL